MRIEVGPGGILVDIHVLSVPPDGALSSSCCCSCCPSSRAFAPAAPVFHLAFVETVSLGLSVSFLLTQEPFLLQGLVLQILSLLEQLVRKGGNREDILEEVVQKDERVELEVGVVTVIELKGFSNALDDHLRNVETLVIDKVDLHHFKILTVAVVGKKISSVSLGTR